MLLFNAAGFLLAYAILRLQGVLPLNPANQSAVPADLAFNTAVSFASNTNWQNYGGESTMSYLTQMMALTTQNFVSAATGIALVIALVRAFARASANTVGTGSFAPFAIHVNARSTALTPRGAGLLLTTSRRAPPSCRTSTIRARKYSCTATPSVSNPPPRFAVEPGTVTSLSKSKKPAETILVGGPG